MNPISQEGKHWTRTIPFKVDVAGVIHIMGSALYSRPQAAVRELIQNAHDAIMRRRAADLTFVGRIDIEQDPQRGELVFRDDGIGLNQEEAETYLGTLGVGITGLLKGEHPQSSAPRNSQGLIGQFGIGLFSAFMLASELEVVSRRADESCGIRWRAGAGTDIELSSCETPHIGTSVRLFLKPEYAPFAADVALLEHAIKAYADYLPIPIYLNQRQPRVNVMHSEWFEPTPDLESLELELAAHFDETPLAVIPIHVGKPEPISGALYVTPQRTPGFSSQPVLTGTVLRMVISANIQDLVPQWASFIRGVLELPTCRPTASREELVRNPQFQAVRQAVDEQLYQYFERLADNDSARFESVLSWHRYTWAGAGLTEERVRRLLARSYRFATSQGQLTMEQILRKSRANPLVETEYDRVVWYNTDRRQERWINSLFSGYGAPCVHTLRSFEESLLAVMVADAAERGPVDLRMASPSSPAFAGEILGVTEMEDAPPPWPEFLASTEAKILCAGFREDQPVMAFLNEKHELLRTFEDLRSQGTIPPAFQRLIDKHLQQQSAAQNEVILNRNHRLVGRALEQSPHSPLASVLRLLVLQALTAAGAAIPRQAQQQQVQDLDWIADGLWGKN
jgi:molecular chaperone HtpG